jgi:hypothetical protein
LMRDQLDIRAKARWLPRPGGQDWRPSSLSVGQRQGSRLQVPGHRPGSGCGPAEFGQGRAGRALKQPIFRTIPTRFRLGRA